MRTASYLFLLLAIVLMIYGYWGAFTHSGNKVFNEMDAYIPFFVLISGAVLFIVFFVLILLFRQPKSVKK